MHGVAPLNILFYAPGDAGSAATSLIEAIFGWHSLHTRTAFGIATECGRIRSADSVPAARNIGRKWRGMPWEAGKVGKRGAQLHVLRAMLSGYNR